MEESIFLTWPQLAIFSLAALILSAGGTAFLIKFLKKHGVVDKPNKRTNHKGAIPRGGGMAVIGTYLLIFILIAWQGELFNFLWSVWLGGFFLMAVSLIDDTKPLPPLMRLVAQILATGMVVIQPHQPLFGDLLPYWLDSIIICFAWVWFINLYNFMDGIDGITGAETIAICLGLSVIAAIANFPPEIATFAFVLMLCIIGFLPFNWHPARIFLGDVGSVPLGFFIGWLLIVLAMYGYWIAAIILPAYYLADSGITLLLRIMRREKIWEPHSKHFYQRAVRGGMKHHYAVLIVSLFNLLFIMLAALSTINTIPVIPILIAVLAAIFILLGYFKSYDKSA